MAQQKPGVMLYFEMRNVFEELSNEKRGILVSAILDYSEHGIQPDFRGSLRIAWASIQPRLDRDGENDTHKCQQRRYAVYIRESKKDGVLPLPLTNGLHPFLTAPKQKHQMMPIGIQLQPQQQQQPQPQQQQQPQQQPQQIVVICPRRASRPGNHSD